MALTHSPAPWHFEPTAEAGAILDADGAIVCALCDDESESQARLTADAALILAAPALLAVLRDFATQAEHYLLDPRRTLDMGQWRASIREARAVIRKVEEGVTE